MEETYKIKVLSLWTPLYERVVQSLFERIEEKAISNNPKQFKITYDIPVVQMFIWFKLKKKLPSLIVHIGSDSYLKRCCKGHRYYQPLVVEICQSKKSFSTRLQLIILKHNNEMISS